MSALRFIGPCIVLAALAGCIGQPTGERSAFLTAAETFGAGMFPDAEEDGPGAGAAAEADFRQELTVTLANNSSAADVDVSFAAWVNVSSVRSGGQQDALIAGGYVQLTREVRLGSAFTLPPGTYVFNGPGTAGATAVRVGRAQGDTAGVATTLDFALITPDVVLVFSEPPTSCENKAFEFTDNGLPLDPQTVPGTVGMVFEGATGAGPVKTLAQVDVYECQPLKPGLFLKLGGGAREPNEFFEGQNIRFDFNVNPDANGNCAVVTIATTAATTPLP
jgi:hypothetical protein